MLSAGDIAKYVLTPGDPARVHRIAAKLQGARKVADNRGIVSFTGSYQGVEVSAVSTGVGCPSAAIVIEELARVGAETIIRVGTTGGMQQHVDPGDIVIPVAATRSDGTTKSYVSEQYPAVASLDVTQALISSATRLGFKPHVGVVWTSDSYYAESGPILDSWAKAGVVSVEMECSAIFTLTRLRGLRSGAILAVDGNLLKGTKKLEADEGDLAWREREEKVQRTIDSEIEIALEAVKDLSRKRP
jgi:uridine phosphorylase